jgi:hypothetical protein
MASILLETMDYGEPLWNYIYNKNMEILDKELLKLSTIAEIDVSTLQDGDTIVWDSTASKWIRQAKQGY